MTEFRELHWNAVVALCLKAATFGATFFLSVAVARTLGPDKAGLFFLALTIVTVASSLARLGCDKPVVRFVASAVAKRNAEDAGAVVTGVLMLTVGSAVVLTMLLMVGAPWVAGGVFEKPELAGPLRDILWSIPALAASGALAYAMQGLGRIALHLLLLSVLTPSIALALVVLGSTTNLGVSTELLYAGGSLATLCVAAVTYVRFRNVLVRTPDWTRLRPVLRSSASTFIVATAQLILLWLPMIMLGMFASSRELAEYHVAGRTAMLIGFVLIAVNSVDAPRYASLYAQGRLDQLEALSRHSTRIMTIAALPITLAFVVLPEMVLGIFGSEFRGAALCLQVLAVGNFIGTASGSVANLLLMTGHEKDFRNICIAAVVICTAVSIALIPAFGALGAAIATGSTLALVNLLALAAARRRLGFHGVTFGT